MHSKAPLRILTYLWFEYYRVRTYSYVTWTIKDFTGKLKTNEAKISTACLGRIVFIFFCVYLFTFSRFLKYDN